MRTYATRRFSYALPTWPPPELVAFNTRPDDLYFIMQVHFGRRIALKDQDDFVDTSYFHSWGPTSQGSFFDQDWVLPNAYPPFFAAYAGCDQPTTIIDEYSPDETNPVVGPVLLALFWCLCAGPGRKQKPRTA